MTRRAPEIVTADATTVSLASELPEPTVVLVAVAAWVASGLIIAWVMAARGHRFRVVAGLAGAMGPLFLPLALDHLRRRDPKTLPVALDGDLGPGPRTIVVLDGPPERAADVLPVLRRLDNPGTVTLAVPIGYSTLRAPEHDADRSAAAAVARQAATLLHEFGAIPVLAPGTTSHVVEHLVTDDGDIVLAVGAFPPAARASADRLGASVVTVPTDGSR